MNIYSLTQKLQEILQKIEVLILKKWGNEPKQKQTKRIIVVTTENKCVFCGEVVPEGRQVCGKCEQRIKIFDGQQWD